MKEPHVSTDFVFKAALMGQKSIWRKIALGGNQTLDNLHAAIRMSAFGSIVGPLPPGRPHDEITAFPRHCRAIA